MFNCAVINAGPLVALSLLERAISGILGTPASEQRLRYGLDSDAKSPILYFRYPSTQRDGFTYVRREVKLEIGTLTDQQPTGRYAITPLIASTSPALFSDW